jgi:hypothetical protein
MLQVNLWENGKHGLAAKVTQEILNHAVGLGIQGAEASGGGSWSGAKEVGISWGKSGHHAPRGLMWRPRAGLPRLIAFIHESLSSEQRSSLTLKLA